MQPSQLLPSTLVYLLLNVLSVSAQSRQKLPLNVVSQFSTGNGPFVIPSEPLLTVSVAVCAPTSALRFFASNESSSATPSSSDNTGTTEILLDNGRGYLTSSFNNGGALAVEGTGPFEIALSNTGTPIHETFSDLPLFGDTTSNQAIIFSPPFSPPTPLNPTYPNYTLYPVDMPQDSRPSSYPNYTLSLMPTTQNAYPWTGCFLSGQAQLQGGTLHTNQSLWLRDEAGWRSQYIIGGLTPSTNYTAFLLLESSKVLGPIYFATKSAAFPCPLVANLPYCPGVAYAMPLDPPPDNADIYTGETLPTALSAPLRSYLTNFTVTLSSFPCGRDMYSQIVSCLDCQTEFRKWLCTVSLPRCSEPSPGGGGATAVPAAPTATGLSATKNDQQQVLSALLPYQTSTPPRNGFLPAFSSPYEMLLPCIESCTAMDRACPPFLGIKCPTAQFNGAASYGIGYIDSSGGDEGQGLTGVAQDRFGNVWCQLG